MAAKYPPSCSFSLPKWDEAKKIGRKARKLMDLNKDTDSGIEKQR